MDGELDEDKERTLNIIDQITGSTSKRVKRKVRLINEIIPRYNPELDEDKPPTDTVVDHQILGDPVPEQTFQTFYEVTDNLTDSFKKKRKSGIHEFNFLAEVDLQEDNDDSDHHSVISEQMEIDTRNDVVMENTNVTDSDSSSSSFLLFFHSMSPELKNRLNESRFCRNVDATSTRLDN